jgi:cytochrome d ubiquinol oxidase subunit II
VVETWFALLALMLITYVVLDGFDLGAGALHLVVAKTDEERRTVIAAIGPVRDGNEVWLIAAGGLLLFAFPRAYAAGLSGFYLPLMMLLWVMILRGISVEFRSHQQNPLWRTFCDAVFGLASAAIAMVLGVALGNLVRGVPVDGSGYFSGPLFTNFRVGPRPGALDWYTVLVSFLALASLSAHAATYLIWKTTGPVHDRCRALAMRLWVCVGALFAAVTIATWFVVPAFFTHLGGRPWAWMFPALVACAGVYGVRAARLRNELGAFLASSVLLAAMLAGTAAVLFPWMLRSTIDEAYTLDAYNSASGRWGLAVGLAWWIPAVLLAIGYFVILFRSLRGKVDPGASHG